MAKCGHLKKDNKIFYPVSLTDLIFTSTGECLTDIIANMKASSNLGVDFNEETGDLSIATSSSEGVNIDEAFNILWESEY